MSIRYTLPFIALLISPFIMHASSSGSSHSASSGSSAPVTPIFPAGQLSIKFATISYDVQTQQRLEHDLKQLHAKAPNAAEKPSSEKPSVEALTAYNIYLDIKARQAALALAKQELQYNEALATKNTEIAHLKTCLAARNDRPASPVESVWTLSTIGEKKRQKMLGDATAQKMQQLMTEAPYVHKLHWLSQELAQTTEYLKRLGKSQQHLKQRDEARKLKDQLKKEYNAELERHGSVADIQAHNTYLTLCAQHYASFTSYKLLKQQAHLTAQDATIFKLKLQRDAIAILNAAVAQRDELQAQQSAATQQ